MNLEETALLLTFAAAFDRRTIGEADVRAWQAVLTGIDLDAAREAVTAHYTDQRDWVMPADITRYVRKKHAQALEDFQYEPDPDETPEQYLARRRQQIRAVAAGRRPAALPALGASPRPKLELAGVGHLPAEEKPAPAAARTPRSIRCPHCGAEPGKPCKTSVLGRKMADVHPSRSDAFKAA